jgi:mannosyltransferase OCH1-like enzyme
MKLFIILIINNYMILKKESTVRISMYVLLCLFILTLFVCIVLYVNKRLYMLKDNLLFSNCSLHTKNNIYKNNLIPKRIIQTWKTHNIGKLEQLSQTWKHFNPSYTYTLFDDVECTNMIREHFDTRVLEAYKNIKPGAFRADLWRYCELYINGGVYSDIDTVCIGSIDDVILSDATFITPIDIRDKELFNAFIAVIKKHPIMLMCIEEVVSNVENNKEQKGFYFSGPGLLADCVRSFLSMKKNESFVFDCSLNKGIQLLKMNKYNEIVYNSSGIELFQNKNKNNMIRTIYKKESFHSGIIKYSI